MMDFFCEPTGCRDRNQTHRFSAMCATPPPEMMSRYSGPPATYPTRPACPEDLPACPTCATVWTSRGPPQRDQRPDRPTSHRQLNQAKVLRSRLRTQRDKEGHAWNQYQQHHYRQNRGRRCPEQQRCAFGKKHVGSLAENSIQHTFPAVADWERTIFVGLPTTRTPSMLLAIPVAAFAKFGEERWTRAESPSRPKFELVPGRNSFCR